MNINSKIAIGSLLWMQTVFLGSTFGTWLAVVATTLLASFIVTGKHKDANAEISVEPPRLTPTMQRLLVAGGCLIILVVSLLWRFGDQTGSEINILSVAVEAIAHWGLFCSLLLWALMPNRGHFAMLGLGMIVLLFGVAGGGASRSMAAQTSIAFFACVGFALAAQIILGTARGTDGTIFANDDSNDDRSRWMGRTVSLITISLILMTTGVVANATNRVLPNVQQAVQEQLQESLDVVVDRTGIGGTRYVRSGKLGSIRQHITANPTEISLYVKSEYLPGYMRGRVYDVYQQRRWYSAARLEAPWPANGIDAEHTVAPASNGKVELEFPLARKLKRFNYPQEPRGAPLPATPTHLIVYNNPTKGYVVFTPLATHWIEANSREVIIDDHDQIGMGVDVTKPYVAGVGSQPRRDLLSSDQVQMLTMIPVPVETEARRVAQEVCPNGGTARNKAAAISRYFQSGFDYSLRSPSIPPGVDPIAHFLKQRHPAHCEFFASATAVVLRAAGIPTRYVTGYVVDEPDEGESQIWLARNRDAHAWVEAYDDHAEQWFAVESTPGRTYKTAAMLDASQASGDSGWISANEDSLGSSNLFGQAWGWLVSLRATDAMVVIFQFAQLPLFLFLVIFWWVKFRRTVVDSHSETDAKSIKMLRRVDRSVSKHALTRFPAETLYQFADRIESDSQNAIRTNSNGHLSLYADWYRQYANARYCGQLPEPLAQSAS